MCARVVALGKERGITGDAIAITPPKGGYQTRAQAQPIVDALNAGTMTEEQASAALDKIYW